MADITADTVTTKEDMPISVQPGYRNERLMADKVSKLREPADHGHQRHGHHGGRICGDCRQRNRTLHGQRAGGAFISFDGLLSVPLLHFYTVIIMAYRDGDHHCVNAPPVDQQSAVDRLLGVQRG